MPHATAPARPPAPLSDALDSALDQSQVVQAEVEACADDLGTANERVEAHIADGARTLPAAQTLEVGKAVEQRVQACADDLDQVTQNLASGLDEVKAVQQALADSRAALAESEALLATSRAAERSACERAMHDAKTGLPNRTLFDDRLAQAVAGADRHGRVLAVLFLDLNHFKRINDTHGHATGDAVLKTVAERLLAHARDEDSVCRNGGDEFLYLLINPAGREAVARIAAGVHQAIGTPIAVGALEFVVTPSIGIALYPEHAHGGQDLIAQADAAMYRAKDRASPFEFFEPKTPGGRAPAPPPVLAPATP